MAPRLMLHATTLAFEHPTTGEWLAGECLPDF
jgi:tRNA pseudouridine32 synthase/23S rRNA pseudouridine746 synthase